MSTVRITATGDDGLSVEVLLGNANRAYHDLEAGDSVDLAVGGNQTLVIDLPREAPSIFVTPDDEPAVETSFIEGQDELPVGVDVLSAAEVDVIATVPAEEGGEKNPEASADQDQSQGEAREAVSIGAGDVGSMEDLFGGSEAQGEAEVIKELKADSPLETGSIADLPNPFDEGEKEFDGKEAEEA